MREITVLGGGLAGCEAAWQLAEAGYKVRLVDQKPAHFSPAHKNPNLCELVCSNSLKASRLASAAGLLKAEMTRMGSLLVPIAQACAVPAGGALAVDREQFASRVTEAVRNHPNITLVTETVTEMPHAPAVIATGPLTEGALAEDIQKRCGQTLYFYDAAAPVVSYDSIDTDKTFFAARYDRGDPDYINCPMDKETYLAFYHALCTAERAPLHQLDQEAFRVYEGCMPIEVLASRGEDAMRYGPLKPVGLRDPRTGERPYAVVQLRKENTAGSLYNLVGFQTNLKFGEQRRVFGMIPGLEHAQYHRYGVMHRNSFLDSPKILNRDFSMKSCPGLYFAGQMTGVEGYMESAASGILAGKNLARCLEGKSPYLLPAETMMGALSYHISTPTTDFQPMGANMGMLPPLERRITGKEERYTAYANRALSALDAYLEKMTEEDQESAPCDFTGR